MAKSKHPSITEAIVDCEYVTAKYKFAQSHYPDIKLNRYYEDFVSKKPFFLSKSVNDSYQKFLLDIERPAGIGTEKVLVAYRFSEIEFDYNSNKEIIRIYSSPRVRTVASIVGPTTQIKGPNISKTPRTIKFSTFLQSLHDKKFDEAMLKACQATAIKFIQEHSHCKLDKTNLDDRVKKLLLFI